MIFYIIISVGLECLGGSSAWGLKATINQGVSQATFSLEATRGQALLAVSFKLLVEFTVL